MGPRRSDGYHELVTVFQAIDLIDELRVVPAAELSLEASIIDAEAETVVQGEDNLAWKAAALLQDRFDVTAGAHMNLSKRIPIAGGMAGGSTDAAAALVACNALWGQPASPAELFELAAELGSDVPFCLRGNTALGSSRGEVLTPVLTTGELSWVVAASFKELSTPAVYRRFDELAGDAVPAPEVPADLMAALRIGDPERIGAALHNDLQRAAISLIPDLDLLLEAGRDYGAVGAMVSGSGPTTVFLAKDADRAVELAIMLSSTGLCKWARVVKGPAPGARVIPDSGNRPRVVPVT